MGQQNKRQKTEGVDKGEEAAGQLTECDAPKSFAEKVSYMNTSALLKRRPLFDATWRSWLDFTHAPVMHFSERTAPSEAAIDILHRMSSMFEGVEGHLGAGGGLIYPFFLSNPSKVDARSPSSLRALLSLLHINPALIGQTELPWQCAVDPCHQSIFSTDKDDAPLVMDAFHDLLREAGAVVLSEPGLGDFESCKGELHPPLSTGTSTSSAEDEGGGGGNSSNRSGACSTSNSSSSGTDPTSISTGANNTSSSGDGPAIAGSRMLFIEPLFSPRSKSAYREIVPEGSGCMESGELMESPSIVVAQLPGTLEIVGLIQFDYRD